MPSPFPGMDPYLEQFWGDVHQSMITYARDQLQDHLPGDLRARVEERVFVESPTGPERNLYPDIRVVERGRDRGVAVIKRPRTQTAVAEPLIIETLSDPITESYIEIIDVGSGKKVVTAIEILSPVNKVPGPGKDLYLKKQQEFLDAKVNLVEIDLLRAGQWVLSVPREQLPAAAQTTYHIIVRRGGRTYGAEVYLVPLRQRLPVFRIPLRPKDKDVLLDVQALVDQCYRNGGYDDDINYQSPPMPPLPPDDALWAQGLLRAKRKSSRPKARKKRESGRRKMER